MQHNPISLLLSAVMPKPLGILPLIMVGMAVAGSMMANKKAQKDAHKQLAAQAKSHGISMGGIDFTADRIAKTFQGQFANLQASKLLANMQVDKNHAQAESDARVAAGVAGVEGQSVDATINETSRTQAEAKGAIADRVKAAKLQLTTDYTDNYLNAHMKKGNADFKEPSQGSKNTEVALGAITAGLGAYASSL